MSTPSVDRFVDLLPRDVAVFHTMLDPEVAVVQGRIAARAHPLDAGTVDQTVEAVHAVVLRGEGRLR